jgi:hypothetical protein
LGTSDDYSGSDEKLFSLKIHFDWFKYALNHAPNFFDNFQNMNWNESLTFAKGDMTYYEGMLYRARKDISTPIKPDNWFDTDNDKINDNPWKILYPWNEGDSVIIEPYGWYVDGDAWIVDLSLLGMIDDDSSDDLKDITVVPNPYIVNSNYFNESPGNYLIRFTHLPSECNISIYTISGELVSNLKHDDRYDGNEWWNLRNDAGQLVAPGLYLYVVETPGGAKKIGKFAVVR